MNNIDKLIKELCPNGVEWKELGEVAKIEIGKQLNRTLLFDNGIYPVQNGGIEPSGFYDEYNTDENTITISQGGASAGFVNFITDKFWAGAHCYVIKKTDDVLLYKYVYYVLKNGQINLQNSKLGAGIPGLNRNTLSKFPIPIPPLPIQQEIVNILDKFTALEAELQAELDARRKQYEYYREKLLTFSEIETLQGGVSSSLSAIYVEWKTLGELCKNVTSGGTPLTKRSDYYNGTIPWLRTQEVDWKDIYDTEIKITELGLANSSAKMIKANCVIIAMYGATTGKSAINKIPLTTNQACCNLEIDNSIANYKYVYYWICKEYENIKSLGEGSQSNINSQKIKSYNIPIPPLSEQNRIVGILDKFEELVNQSLPAEIEARRKQYEYYREKLLTFGTAGFPTR